MTQEPDEALIFAELMSFDREVQGALAHGYRAGYRAGQAAAEARVKELEALLEKANKPWWFYTEPDGASHNSTEETIDFHLNWGRRSSSDEQSEVVRIRTVRPCADIWAAIRVFTAEEREAREDDEEYEFTEHASREEAEAALKGGDE